MHSCLCSSIQNIDRSTRLLMQDARFPAVTLANLHYVRMETNVSVDSSTPPAASLSEQTTKVETRDFSPRDRDCLCSPRQCG